MKSFTLQAGRELRFIIHDPTTSSARQAVTQGAGSNSNAGAGGEDCHLKLKKGTAEIFGANVRINEGYIFNPGSYAVYSWYGCTLELNPLFCQKIYEESDTPMELYVGIHGNLELLRAKETHKFKGGPRIAVVGPGGVGKTTVATVLAAYAARCEENLVRTRAEYGPIYVDLDTKDGNLSIPGTISAEANFKSANLTVTDGFVTRGALSFFTGYENPSDAPGLFQEAIQELAKAVDRKLTARSKQPGNTRHSGVIIDTFPLSLDSVSGEIEYKLLLHLLKTFRVDIILVLGIDRLVSELKADLDAVTSGTADPTGVHILKLQQSGASVKKDAVQRHKHQVRAIKRFFEGTPELPLVPTRRTYRLRKAENLVEPETKEGEEGETEAEDEAALPEVIILKLHDKYIASEAILPVGEQAVVKPTNATAVNTVTEELVGQVLAISYSQTEEEVTFMNPMRNVPGFVFVESIDSEKNRLTMLVPSPAELPSNILLQGDIKWTEL